MDDETLIKRLAELKDDGISPVWHEVVSTIIGRTYLPWYEDMPPAPKIREQIDRLIDRGILTGEHSTGPYCIHLPTESSR